MSIRSSFQQAVLDSDKPLAALTALLVIGALIAGTYGWMLPGGGISGMMLLLAILFASISVGSLTGFLFGIPRFDYSSGSGKPIAAKPPVEPTTSQKLATSDPTAPARYRPSTNLDDIADWLTKIIVGIGLTQLTNIGPGLNAIAHEAISPCDRCGSAEGFVTAVILYGAIGGFLFAYVWTRLHYAKMAARSDMETNQTLREFELSVEATLGTGGKGPPPETSSSGSPPPAVSGGAASVGAGQRITTQTTAITDNDDPNKGRFGGSALANGRVLRATIEPSETRQGIYRVTLRVSAFGPAPKLVTPVIFHLHPTFQQQTVSRAPEDGVATLTVLAYGAFTVGAVTDGGATRLELDLADLPDAPKDFRSR